MAGQGIADWPYKLPKEALGSAQAATGYKAVSSTTHTCRHSTCMAGKP